MDINYEGLNLHLDNYKLYLDNEEMKADYRKFSELNDVLMEKTNEEGIAYYMYRGICNKKDYEIFKKYEIRFDITILIPKLFGIEYNKTYGHYHPKNNRGYSYPELYEVIYGRAIFLLQSDDFKKVFIIDAKEGDQIFIYPNFGHVTINFSENKPLIISNLVYTGFSSDYSIFRKKNGAIYYITRKGLIKNKNYEEEPEIIRIKAGKLFEDNLYLEFVNDPENFLFLKDIEI